MRSSHRHKDKGCLLNGKFETSKRNSVKCKKMDMISHCKVCMKVGILTMKLFGKHYLFFYLLQCQEKNCFLIFIFILCIAFMIWPDYAWTSMRYKLF